MRSHRVREHNRRNAHVHEYVRGKGVRSYTTSAYHGAANLFRGGGSTELTTEQRKELPESAFAIPSERAYPVPTVEQLRKVGAARPEASAERHARNALARVAQHGSAYEKGQVCRIVSSRFPGVHAQHCRIHDDPPRHFDAFLTPQSHISASSKEEARRKAEGRIRVRES